MHLNDIGLPQIIVSSNYDVSYRKIFSRWSVQLLDESLFGNDDIFIVSHVSYTIIDWLMHNNARDEITLRFITFFNRFCRLCRLYCHPLLFAVVRIAVFYRF